MYDLKIKSKNGMTFISIKKGMFKQLDMEMISILNKRLIPNICAVDLDKHRCIYSIPESETLHNLLKKDNGEIYELLISSVIQLTRMLRKYDLPVCNILFNPKAVFYCSRENKIYYIYQPYKKTIFNNSSNISTFLFNLINKYLFRKKNISDEISNEMINRKYYTVFEKEDMAGKDRVYKKEYKRDINNTYDDKTVFLGREEDDDLTVFMGKKHREM